jgi:hypothetical protein
LLVGEPFEHTAQIERIGADAGDRESHRVLSVELEVEERRDARPAGSVLR